MSIEKIQDFIGAPITGLWDKITVEKACEFQKKHKLSETGLPSKQLKDLIQSLLYKRSKREKKLQQKIK